MNHEKEETCMVSDTIIYVCRGPESWEERHLSSLADLISFLAENEWDRYDVKAHEMSIVKGLEDSLPFRMYLNREDYGFSSEEEAFYFFGFEQIIDENGQHIYQNRFGKRPEDYDVYGFDSEWRDIFGEDYVCDEGEWYNEEDEYDEGDDWDEEDDEEDEYDEDDDWDEEDDDEDEYDEDDWYDEEEDEFDDDFSDLEELYNEGFGGEDWGI